MAPQLLQMSLRHRLLAQLQLIARHLQEILWWVISLHRRYATLHDAPGRDSMRYTAVTLCYTTHLEEILVGHLARTARVIASEDAVPLPCNNVMSRQCNVM